MSNRSALAYWEMMRHSRSEVEQEFNRISASALNEREMLVLLEFDVEKSQVNCRENDERKSDVFKRRLETLLPCLQADLGLGLAGPKNGLVLLWLADGAPAPLSKKVPVFVFSKSCRDFYSVAMPDPDFVASCGYASLMRLQAVEAEIRPWAQRKNTALWRGSDTGYEEEFPNGRFIPRVHLCLAARDLQDRTLVDAAIARVVHPERKSKFEGLGILGEFIPAAQFVRYKYLIDIDGYYCAWSSTFQKLSSTSVVLKVESECQQWYYDRLVPWEHYIPVKHDLSDLEDRVVWAREHDTACEQIAARARKFITGISFGGALVEFGTAAARILDSQDDR